MTIVNEADFITKESRDRDAQNLLHNVLTVLTRQDGGYQYNEKRQEYTVSGWKRLNKEEVIYVTMGAFNDVHVNAGWLDMENYQQVKSLLQGKLPDCKITDFEGTTSIGMFMLSAPLNYTTRL
jgi:hypothetical protein